MFSPLTITTPAGSYDIITGAGILHDLPTHLTRLGLTGRIWLVSDAAVATAYGEPLLAALRDGGFRVQAFTVPSGEQSKNLAVAAEMYTWLIEHNVERRDTVLALGGGVVGDLAGFVAATTLRGLNFVQLPTTLLAMVDSALGGKTGVNHPLGKNLIGAFHQPRLVLADVQLLATLPARELRSGWAEVIKHGVIRDVNLFTQLEQYAADFGFTILDLREEDSIVNPKSKIVNLIRRAAAVKVDVVNIDEREQAERMLLNYGHTLGHAIEAAAGYGTVLHGEAVAIGMDLAARIAIEMGMFSQGELERQRHLLAAYGLSIAVPAALTTDEILARTLRDKKIKAGTIRWVLPVCIGEAVVRNDVPEALVRRVVESAERS